MIFEYQIFHVFFSYLINPFELCIWPKSPSGGARWLDGRVSDTESSGFDTHAWLNYWPR